MLLILIHILIVIHIIRMSRSSKLSSIIFTKITFEKFFRDGLNGFRGRYLGVKSPTLFKKSGDFFLFISSKAKVPFCLSVFYMKFENAVFGLIL